MKIEVRSAFVAERDQPFTNKKGAQEVAHFRDQSAWAYVTDPNGQPSPYPIAMSISLEKDQAPWPVGSYILDESSLYIGKFNKLQVGKIKLKAIAASAQKAA